MFGKVIIEMCESAGRRMCCCTNWLLTVCTKWCWRSNDYLKFLKLFSKVRKDKETKESWQSHENVLVMILSYQFLSLHSLITLYKLFLGKQCVFCGIIFSLFFYLLPAIVTFRVNKRETHESYSIVIIIMIEVQYVNELETASVHWIPLIQILGYLKMTTSLGFLNFSIEFYMYCTYSFEIQCSLCWSWWNPNCWMSHVQSQDICIVW